MKQFILQAAALVIIIFIALAVSFQPDVASKLNLASWSIIGTDSSGGGDAVKNLTILSSEDQTRGVISTEIADTKEKKGKGLGGRESLASESGMLFTFDSPSIYKFWMKDMHFPLDFIWILNDKVVDILPNVDPPAPGVADSGLTVYQPQTNIDKILEVNAGYAASHNVQIGDHIKLEDQ